MLCTPPSLVPKRPRLALPALEPRDCPVAGWTMYGHDVLGSRNNTSEHILNASNVSQLGLKWNYPGFTYSVPSVFNRVVYAGTGSSVVALNEKDGTQKWLFDTGATV